MNLDLTGRLPERNFLRTKNIDYDYIDWEFVSLQPDSISLKLKYYKNIDGEDKMVYERLQTNKLLVYPKTKTISIMSKNARLDVTNLLLKISNELFENCRPRENDRCILTKAEV